MQTDPAQDYGPELHGIPEIAGEDDFPQPEEPSARHEPESLSKNLDPKKWYFVKFGPRSSQEEPLEPEVIINGYGMRFKRNVKHCVPWEVLHALDNAKPPRGELRENPQTGRQEMSYEYRFRIPYQIEASCSRKVAEDWYRTRLNSALPRIPVKQKRTPSPATAGKKR